MIEGLWCATIRLSLSEACRVAEWSEIKVLRTNACPDRIGILEITILETLWIFLNAAPTLWADFSVSYLITDKFRVASVPSTSDSSVCWDPLQILGVQNERSENALSRPSLLSWYIIVRNWRRFSACCRGHSLESVSTVAYIEYVNSN